MNLFTARICSRLIKSQPVRRLSLGVPCQARVALVSDVGVVKTPTFIINLCVGAVRMWCV